MGAPKLYWFEKRRCWRFPFRDPNTGERKFLFCTPEKFELAGIDLDSDEVVRRRTKASEGLAKRLQTAFLRSLGALEPEPDRRDADLTLTDAIESYFDLYDGQSAGYRKGLRAIFEEFRDVVGDRPVDTITDQDLKAYERVISARVKRTSVRSYLRQLGMLLNFCCKKGWLREDPRLTYKMPREELATPNPFTDEELARFFEVVERGRPLPHGRFDPAGWDYLRWMGLGLLHLGLRPIELEHARWEHVDFDERFLFVSKSHANKEPQALQNQPISLAVWPEFEARRKPSGLIWTSARGGAVTPGVLHRSRQSLRDHLPGFMWKRFRKTYATALQRAGNDIVVVSRLLRQSAGGKNTTVAERHYIGKSERHLRDVVDEAFGTAASVARARTLLNEVPE